MHKSIEIMDQEFYTKDGFLSSYSFKCGYVEKLEIDDNNRKSMYMEHCTYHVCVGLKMVYILLKALIKSKMQRNIIKV